MINKKNILVHYLQYVFCLLKSEFLISKALILDSYLVIGLVVIPSS